MIKNNTIYCDHCGKKVKRQLKRDFQYTHNFCDNECRIAYIKTHKGFSKPYQRTITKPCEICGIPYQAKSINSRHCPQCRALMQNYYTSKFTTIKPYVIHIASNPKYKHHNHAKHILSKENNL